MHDFWEFLSVAVPVLVGPGGILVVWLALRHPDDPVSKEIASGARAEAVVQDSGIGAQWRELVDKVQAHADDIEARLTKRIDAQDVEIADLKTMHKQDRRLIGALHDYVEDLKNHIIRQLPPPPPDPRSPLLFDDDGVFSAEETDPNLAVHVRLDSPHKEDS